MFLTRLAPVVAGLALCLAVPAVAAPAAPPSATEKLARLHYEAGKQAFDLGRFVDAAAEFQRGYDLSKRPLFLLNLAQTMFRLERYDEAVRFCQRYLSSPAPAAQAEARMLLAQAEMHQRLRESAADGVQATPEPAPVTTTAISSAAATGTPTARPASPAAHADGKLASTSTTHRPGRPALAWSGVALLVVGVGATAGAVALQLIAAQLNQDFNHPAQDMVYDRGALDRWTTDSHAALGLFVGGGVALVAGVTMTAVGWRAAPAERPRRWSLLPVADGRSFGLSATLRY